MNARLLVIAACTALVVTGCSAGSTPPVPAPTTSSTVTTTADVPGADPAAWFEAYCGPMGVVEVARLEILSKVPQGMAAVKEAVVSWASAAAVSNRKTADDIEKLGPMGSDVRNPHERLIQSLRQQAKGFDDASTRLQALAADDKFPERYQQAMVMSGATGGSSENVQALFKQIVETPKYAATFRANKVCTDWQALAKQAGGK